MDDSYEFDGSIISLSSFGDNAAKRDQAAAGAASLIASSSWPPIEAPAASAHTPFETGLITRECSPAPRRHDRVNEVRLDDAHAQVSTDASRTAPDTTSTVSGPDQTEGDHTAHSDASTSNKVDTEPAEHDQSQPAQVATSSTSSADASSPRLGSASAAAARFKLDERSTYSRQSSRQRLRLDTADSSSENDHSSTSSGPEDVSNLLMPSMRIGHTAHESARTWSRSGSHTNVFALSTATQAIEPAKVLIVGKTSENRATLANLLDSAQDGSDHMSMSFVSTQFSERSRTSSRHVLSDELDDLLVELSGHSDYATFVHPPSSSTTARELQDVLQAPLERLEAVINRSYPSTSRLLDVALRAGSGEIEACLMLMSSPPTASEVAYAKALSHVIPLFPVLVLPPNPSSKLQKTHMLVSAVTQQLTTAGVRWVSAIDCHDRKSRTPALHLLPHELFTLPEYEHVPSNTATGPSSLTSSQELAPPPSPTSSTRPPSSVGSRSSSPTGTHDLVRLRTFVNTLTSRERIRKLKALSFLEWREVEVAARGHQLAKIESLPVEWNETAAASCDGSMTGDRGKDGEIEFSKRVAERRIALAARNRTEVASTRLHLSAETAGAVAASDSPVPPPRRRDTLTATRDADSDRGEGEHDQARGPTGRSGDYFNQPQSSSLTELAATTPRPAPLSLSSSSTTTTRSSLNPTASHGVGSPLLQESFVLSGVSSPSNSMMLLHSGDPFHLPSLLHLVGLNIRLALLPASLRPRHPAWRAFDEHGAAEQGCGGNGKSFDDRDSVGTRLRQWFSTAALFGLVFVAGMVCGAGTQRQTPLLPFVARLMQSVRVGVVA
ncbi:hypothetical protein ACM66B_003670 [Microbotryomycetes sp. NB124-2]